MLMYHQLIDECKTVKERFGKDWIGINPEYMARMRIQNRFRSAIEIAK